MVWCVQAKYVRVLAGAIMVGLSARPALASMDEWRAALEASEAAPLVKIMLLLAGILLTAGAVLLIDNLFRWSMALLYNRKACRLPARLIFAGRMTQGIVTTLGCGGFRFQPFDADAFDRLLAPPQRATQVQLCLDDGIAPAVTRAVYLNHADFLFDTPLALRRQKKILAQSVVRPVLVKKSAVQGKRRAPVSERPEKDAPEPFVSLATKRRRVIRPKRSGAA